MQELKPCPFCGGEARYNEKQLDVNNIVVGYDCLECGAASTVFIGTRLNISKLETDARAAWNRRHNDDRTIVLPVPIGALIYVPYSFNELDGVIEEGVDELHLSGYINEEGHEFYTTYGTSGVCDIEPNDLFTTREAAEAALKAR